MSVIKQHEWAKIWNEFESRLTKTTFAPSDKVQRRWVMELVGRVLNCRANPPPEVEALLRALEEASEWANTDDVNGEAGDIARKALEAYRAARGSE